MRSIIYACALALVLSGCGSVATFEQGEGGGSSTATPGVVAMSFVVHLEGHDSGSENELGIYAGQIRTMMDTFEAHGAKLSFESEAIPTGEKQSLVQGIQLYGENVLTEAVERGHWVGLHGSGQTGLEASMTQFEADLVDQKDELATIGIDAVNVSNVCSELDWVTALADTGFLFATSIVEYCAKSLPVEEQSQSTKDCTAPNVCHTSYPLELERRLHPWRASSPSWLEPDPNGPLVILPQVYNFTCIAEEYAEAGSYLGCDITGEDETAYVAVLESAIAQATADQVTSLNVVWSFGGHPTTAELDEVDHLLATLEGYVDSGQARFATAKEVYDELCALETH